VADLARGDLGLSLTTGQPVLKELLLRLPASLEIVLMALVRACAIAIAIPMRVMAATGPGSWVDQLTRPITTAGVWQPTFFTGLLLAYVFCFLLGWPPPLGRLDPVGLPPELLSRFPHQLSGGQKARVAGSPVHTGAGVGHSGARSAGAAGRRSQQPDQPAATGVPLRQPLSGRARPLPPRGTDADGQWRAPGLHEPGGRNTPHGLPLRTLARSHRGMKACGRHPGTAGVIQRKPDAAKLLLRAHIEQSKAEVRKITLATLHEVKLGTRARRCFDTATLRPKLKAAA